MLGVDPDARMADLARRLGVEAEVAKFEAWDSGARAFDAVIAGQAWHWVDPVAGALKAAQVLRPGGRLAVSWNSFRPPADVGEAFAMVHRRGLPDSPLSRGAMPGPDAYSALRTKAADGMRQAGAFADSHEWRFDWDRPYTRDEWLDVVPAFGGYSQIRPAKQEECRPASAAPSTRREAVSRWATPPWWPPRHAPDHGRPRRSSAGSRR